MANIITACCRTCCHWHISEKNRAGEWQLTPMGRLSMGSCDLTDEPWRYYGGHHHCPKHQALPAARQLRRDQELKEAKKCKPAP